jgi:type II secretory pathway component GspD/PulD (secretin)
MFLNERKGELIVRASREDMDEIEKIIKSMRKGPPIVQIESKFVEVAIKELPIPYRITPRWGPAMARISAKNLDVSVLTEKQFREVLTAFENAAGADVLTGPAVVTISGRKARLSVEETRSVIYQQSPTLPKDTSPDADPTPRNQGRLPFPPGFLPSEATIKKFK